MHGVLLHDDLASATPIAKGLVRVRVSEGPRNKDGTETALALGQHSVGAQIRNDRAQ